MLNWIEHIQAIDDKPFATANCGSLLILATEWHSSVSWDILCNYTIKAQQPISMLNGLKANKAAAEDFVASIAHGYEGVK